jgi:hypothetical protein
MTNDKVKTLDILVLPPQDKPVFFFVIGDRDDPKGVSSNDIAQTEASKSILYNDITCPTNWMGRVVEISTEGNHDPHGLFRYLRDIPFEDYKKVEKYLSGEETTSPKVYIDELFSPTVDARDPDDEVPLFDYNSVIGVTCDYIAQYTNSVTVWENDKIVDPSKCKDVFLSGNIRVMKDGFAIASGCPIAVYDNDDNDVFPTVDFSNIKRIIIDDTFFGEKHITIESGITLLFKYS